MSNESEARTEKDYVLRSARRRTAFNGRFEALSGRGTVAVRNISCTGAMFEGDTLPPVGREIVLVAAGFEFFGTVIWSDGTRCGLRFEEPLSTEDVLALHSITPEQVRSAELKAAAEWFTSRSVV